jgi:hypothetical protein
MLLDFCQVFLLFAICVHSKMVFQTCKHHYYIIIIELKKTLDLYQSLICNIYNALVGCDILSFGTGGWQKMLVFAQFSSGMLPLLTQ